MEFSGRSSGSAMYDTVSMEPQMKWSLMAGDGV